MAIENWIDSIAAVWDSVDNGKGGKVRSYRVFEKDEFPEALTDFPCAITYPQGVKATYGSVSVDLWRGATEFHLFPNEKKNNFPALLRYYRRIIVAAAANLTLGGKVAHFLLLPDEQNIRGPVVLQYGTEMLHHGLMVYWEVKELTTVTVTG